MDFDEIKYQQILINLLSNAIKFTPDYGSVKVMASQVEGEKAPFLKIVGSQQWDMANLHPTFTW